MNAVTKPEPAHHTGEIVSMPWSPPVPPSETMAIVQMIERAATDPRVDIEKMERLLQMRDRVSAQAAKAAYASALSMMQPELPVITKRGTIHDKNGRPQSHYALWEDINEAIKPALAKHGFALSFRVGREEGQIVVTGVLSHRDGHSEETSMHLPVDTSGAKNAVQAVGSSTSYGKRYTAGALLNLTARGEDDDGRAAGGTQAEKRMINEEELRQLRELVDAVDADEAKFCRYLKVPSLDAMPVSRLPDAMAALRAKALAENGSAA